MRTPVRHLRLDKATWDCLEGLAEIFVPDEKRKRHASKKSSKIAPLLRMLGTGELIILPPTIAQGGDSGTEDHRL